MTFDPDETAIVKTSTLLARQEGSRQPSLQVLKGMDIGRAHRLAFGSTLIGRSPKVDLPLPDEGISRIHAEIVVNGEDEVYVRDCGSTNGTFLNGERLNTTLRALGEGDRIQLSGNVLFQFSFQDPLEESVRQQLYNSAVRDPLTHCYNKRYFQDRLHQEFAYAVRHNRPISLIVFDLDHFKQINDRFGHDIGDEVLRELAGRVQQALRQEEVFARYGGEEFIVLMRDTALEQATLVAERLRRVIAESPVHAEGRNVEVTASFGVASTSVERFDTPHPLFTRADQQLYRAKRAGRNQVMAGG
ncbi:MAG: GGDEF domain-containing protein [Alphaproteobacteria bacterium]|nr:GGDEF domain-containing protein [Alphaproteobacteria bacterium]